MPSRTQTEQRLFDRAFLTVLDYTRGQRLCEIARRLGLSAPGASKYLHRLERAGRVHRTQEGGHWLFWRELL